MKNYTIFVLSFYFSIFLVIYKCTHTHTYMCVYIYIYISVFNHCCCSVTQSCLTLCDSMDFPCQAFLSFTISWSLLKLMSIELVMPSNHLILCHHLLLLPSIFPSIKGQSTGTSASELGKMNSYHTG